MSKYSGNLPFTETLEETAKRLEAKQTTLWLSAVSNGESGRYAGLLAETGPH